MKRVGLDDRAGDVDVGCDSSGTLGALMSELYAVGWRALGRRRQWVWSVFPSLGLAVHVARGYAACEGGGRWRVYGTRVCRSRRRPGRGYPGPPAGGATRGAPTGLVPEQMALQLAREDAGEGAAS